MNVLYTKNDCFNKEQERILSNIKSALTICSPLDISCSAEDGIWGIWIIIDGVRYLVNPIDLVDSIFMDNDYFLLEIYPKKNIDVSCRRVDIHKHQYFYSWSFYDGLTKDALPVYYNFEEYVSKIKSCVEALYSALKSENEVAYDKFDFDIDALRLAISQMNMTATMPSYYRLMTNTVKEEVFEFEIKNDEYYERYVIGIGDRKYKTFLTHWDNSYETIRFQLESFVYNRETTIKLSFDMSNTVVNIKHVDILDTIVESDGGRGFKYKEYALVEIHPNEFVKCPIVKGYCNLKQTIKTFYEGLLILALAHPLESRDEDEEPSRKEAYNMFKSLKIERYLCGFKGSFMKAELRQIFVKHVLIINSDYDEVIKDSFCFDNEQESGCAQKLCDKYGNQLMIPELMEWKKECSQVINDGVRENNILFDWVDYHRRGMDLAQKLRKKLPQDVDLWYSVPAKDKSGTIPRSVLICEMETEEND